MKPNSLYRLLLLVLSFFMLSFCTAQKNDSDTNKRSKSAADSVTEASASRASLGEAADFEKTTLDGETIRLSDYRGKVVMLNFWATWCAPCRREIPALIDLQEKYADQGLVIIGVALDEKGREVVAPYANEMEINYPIIFDDYSYGEEFGGIYMVPTTFLVDQKGNIAARKIGEISFDEMIPRVEKLLNRKER